MTATGPSTLYRFFDATGRLLYVGITIEPTRRIVDHRSGTPFWSEVASASFDRYSDRRSAEIAELEAIASERPVWNRSTWNAAGPAYPKQLRLLPAGALLRKSKPLKPPKVKAPHPKPAPFVMADFIKRLQADEPFRRMAYDLATPETHKWLDFVIFPEVPAGLVEQSA